MSSIKIIKFSDSNNNYEFQFSEFSSDISIVQSFYEIIEVFNNTNTEYVLIINKDFQFGKIINENISVLIKDLDESYPNWSVCSSAGTTCLGSTVKYQRTPPVNWTCSLYQRPVLFCDGGIALVKKSSFKPEILPIKSPNSFSELLLCISLLGLKNKALPIIDSRLFGVQSNFSHKDTEASAKMIDFLRENFSTYIYRLPYATFNLNEHIAFSNKSDPRKLFKDALINSRKSKPKIGIITRTKLNRPHLLKRCINSVFVESLKVREYLEVTHYLVSDDIKIEVEGKKLIEEYKQSNLTFKFIEDDSKRSSRTNLMINSINENNSDYVLFLDDDDFLLPESLEWINLASLSGENRIYVCGSSTFIESWSQDGVLKEFIKAEYFPPEGVFEVFSGENKAPICAFLFPTKLLKNALSSVKALGDFLEDYFMITTVLLSERIDIELISKETIGISLRKGQNSIFESNSTKWDKSYAEFFSEITSNKEKLNPLLWQLWHRL